MRVVEELFKMRLGLIRTDNFKGQFIHHRAMTYEAKYENALGDVLDNMSNPICCVDLSYNRMLCSYHDGTISIHDASPSYRNGERAPILTLAETKNKSISPSNLHCTQWRAMDYQIFTSTGDSNTLSVFFVEKMNVIDTIQIEGCKKIYQHTYNPHCLEIIGVVGKKGTVHVIDLRTGCATQTLSGPFARMVALSWSPVHPNRIVSVSREEVVGWDLRNNRQYACTSFPDFGLSHPISPSMKILPDGQSTVVLTPNGSLYTFDTDYLNYEVLIEEVDVRPNRRRYVFDYSCQSTPHLLFLPGTQLAIYNLSSGTFIKNLIAHSYPVIMAIYNDINHELYSISDDHHTLIWEPPTETPY